MLLGGRLVPGQVGLVNERGCSQVEKAPGSFKIAKEREIPQVKLFQLCMTNHTYKYLLISAQVKLNISL